MAKSYFFLLITFVFFFCLISRIESFNASSYSTATKQSWCGEQTAVCTNYCWDNGTKGTSSNTCEPNTLTYSCVCSDGKTPDKNYYTMPIDYFKCSNDQNDCTAKCGPANQECVNSCSGNCAATIKKTYTYPTAAYASPTSTPATTSKSNSSPSSLLTPSLSYKLTPAITIGFFIVFLTSMVVFSFRL